MEMGYSEVRLWDLCDQIDVLQIAVMFCLTCCFWKLQFSVAEISSHEMTEVLSHTQSSWNLGIFKFW